MKKVLQVFGLAVAILTAATVVIAFFATMLRYVWGPLIDWSLQ